MKKVDVIRAWKDEAYRASLTDEQRANLPPNPAGVVEVNDEYLRGASGGYPPIPTWCCTVFCSDSCCKYYCP